ncbi:MAG: hypothetical protein JST89_08820 [Cyanobacteria bacterium SZAS-4]|nr:hypothetical protein [Cyanobacteria bacterium SZAS-4]
MATKLSAPLIPPTLAFAVLTLSLRKDRYSMRFQPQGFAPPADGGDHRRNDSKNNAAALSNQPTRLLRDAAT